MSKNRILLSISGLEKSFGERKLFRIERLDVFAGDRIGLVGANGSGKTTLLMLLCGEMEPDAGKIERFGDLSCLHQFGAADEAFAPGQWSTRGGYSGGEKIRRASAVAKPGGNMTPREAHLNDFLSMHKSTDTKQRGMERAANAVKMRLERLEVKEKPREDPRASFNFSLTNPPEGKTALRAEALCYGYPGLKRKLLEKVSFELPTGRHTLLCGANSCGKTTLLNLLARAAEGGLPPDARGTVYTAPKMRLGYFYQGLENLDLNKTALENVMEDSVQSEGAVRGILAKLLLRGADFEKKAGVLSGGERIRLQFAKLFASPANVLFLDEPTNFLDLPSIEALQEVLTEYEGTVLFVSHDRAVGKLSARKVENKEELEQQYQQLLAELRQCQ